ncbi:MAG TPA: N-acetylmuramoyl-L-alanine amidase [Sediminispirochaeta sp.]|nr:N-acetylmuramoyl-L-alanine amidase [Sediminispirochaeta sp.]
MVRFKKIFTFTLVVFFLAAVLHASDTLELDQILKKTGASFQWDPMRGVGKIYKNDQSYVLREDSRFLLINYQELRTIDPPTRSSGGDLSLSREDADFLLHRLGLLPDRSNQLFVSTIIIDAGHGGRDSGAIGRFSDEQGEAIEIMEKDLVLKVALDLAGLLKSSYKEKNIVLTRDRDEYLSLEERTEIANDIDLGEQEAMIFISIHANASLNSKAKGFEVWYLPPDYRRKLIDPETLDESAREVAPILNTMLEEEYTVESILLAKRILQGLEGRIGAEHENRGLKEETWFVVRNARMPSVLVEIGFVTHREEALKMRDPDHLKKIAEGIYNGVHDFVEHFEQPFSME